MNGMPLKYLHFCVLETGRFRARISRQSVSERLVGPVTLPVGCVDTFSGGRIVPVLSVSFLLKIIRVDVHLALPATATSS